MPLRIEIDKLACQSSGNCADALPEAFRIDADDLGEVLPGAAQQSREKLVAAAKRCPALAITIYDEDGSEIDLD